MTQDQADLMEKADDSLGAARLLLSQDYFDFAISRTYYAMFYVVQAVLLIEGLSFSSHAATIGAFVRHFVKPKRLPAEYHRFLIDAQNVRIIGDYRVRTGLTADRVQEHIDRAARFLELGRSMLAP